MKVNQVFHYHPEKAQGASKFTIGAIPDPLVAWRL